MSSAKKLMGTTAVGGALAIEDVFSTYLYTGTGLSTTINIVNGIDLAGEGGMVWIKSRSNANYHSVHDTERGPTKELITNTTGAEATNADTITQFNSDGFLIDDDGNINDPAAVFASWTFRKAPRFFDVVTYTGTGANQTIAHNLGTTFGTVIIKCTNTTTQWMVGHKDLGLNGVYPNTIILNSASAKNNGSSNYFTQEADDANFYVGIHPNVNGAGNTYVAYLFAHDPLGPSGDGSDGLIACGSYTGNGAADGPEIDLGWEPQWLLIKSSTDGTTYWQVIDTTRGMTSLSSSALAPNASDAESVGSARSIIPSANGFKLFNNFQNLNGSGQSYIYIAIRRGPMRQPTSGDEVFTPVAYTSDNTDNRLIDTGILTDAVILKSLNAVSNENPAMASRHTHNTWLRTNTTDVETFDADGLMSPVASTSYSPFSAMNGFGVGNDSLANFNYSSQAMIAYAFKRAPSFFDVVTYTGTGVARTLQHSLGVAPEMYWVKTRNGSGSWWCYHSAGGATKGIILNSTGVFSTSAVYFNDTEPTDTVFSVGTWGDTNANGESFIAYLFASCPGVSKVGSYTGNGSSQTINCGFTTGARFILIKRTDSTGDWYVWDTARGIVAGNDPHFSLNSNAVEITTDDSVDPDSSGFIVNQDAATNINVSSATYIYLAIA